ncbi:MFS transporter [Mycena crocata]|nr:MFS transporter [Mycena crocata]
MSPPNEPMETTPLVQGPPLSQDETDDPVDRPLPKLQIALLCFARLIEPMAFFTIFPFVSQMVFDTGTVDERDVGFYTGIIASTSIEKNAWQESLFSVTQMALMLLWGRAADRYGRKPVLVVSLGGQSVVVALFGLSTQIWQMIVLRCMAGVFAGTVVTVRAMISENSTQKTEARAFSLFTFANNLGIFLGPFIGGVFSDPATQMPFIFGRIQFFRDFPYFLPCFISGLFAMTAAVTSALYIKETLVKGAIDGTAPRRMSTMEILQARGVAKVLFVYGQLLVLAFGYTAVVPVFCFTAIPLGGFGFTPFQISWFLGASGAAQAFWLLVIFPPLQLRLGTKRLLTIIALIYPAGFVIMPLLNFSLRQGWIVFFWTVLPVFILIWSGYAMSFTGIQLALNAVSPSPLVLGTLNAIALTLLSATRAVSPVLFSSIFAAGIRHQVLGGYLVWAVLIGCTVAYAATVPLIPASPIPLSLGATAEREEEEEEEEEEGSA